MKIKHLLIGMLAMAAAVACKQDEPVEEPVLEVNKTAVALAATAAEGAFEVTANNAWSADADADWVSLDPANGAGGEKAVVVKVTAEDNTAEARTATVTVKSGNLTRTLKVAQAAAAAGPGDDPTPGDVTWSMMGCFVDNLWSSDVPMTKEGEWIVAKGAQFTELTFKIRGNGSWDDATNIGVAPGSDRGVVNGKVAVVTAEYAKANLGGDAADIRINGEAGTYDVYFSFENLEVYVMEQGYKPGEKEPQNPDPVEITYTVVGTLNNINWNNSAPEGLMTFDGQYHVAKNVPFVTAATLYGGADQFEFKIVETGSWTGYGRVEDVVNPVNTEIAVKLSGDNIMVSGAEGNYDVYFDKQNAKVWVLTPGETPGETPEAPVTPVTEGVIWENDGTVGAAAWSGSPYRFAKEGMDGQNECVAEIPAAVWEGMKIASFSVNVKPAPEATWWQIRVVNGWWGEQWPQANPTADGGEYDIKPTTEGVVDNGDGTYTFTVEFGEHSIVPTLDEKHLLFAGDGFIINKIYFGEAETPGEPETPAKSGWYLVGSFTGTGWGWDAAAGIELDVLDANYFVYYGLELTEGAQFKFLQGTAWGAPEVGAAASVTEPNTIQVKGTMNIAPPAGKYDIYLAADASKFFVMSEGKTPAEATEPAPVDVTYTVAGTIKDNNWNNALPAALMVKEGDYLVAKNLELLWESTCYAGAEQLAIKIFETGNWNAGYGLAAKETYAANVEIPVVANGAENISIIAPEGTYDVYFDKDNAKVWVMEPGLKPGETPAPEPEYTLDGKQWMAEMEGMQVLFDFGLAEEGMLVVGMPSMDGTGFGLYMAGLYEIVPTNGTSGVITFTQYDWEWDEFGDPVEIPYSELTATTVKAVSEGVFGTTEPISFTLVENPYEIAPPQTGGDGPSGAIENGEYWFFNGEKVMAPLAEGVTTGTLPAGNVISGASTEKNIFTLTYDPDMTYYTIQDSYGRYLGQTDETGNITVTDVLPTDDTYAFYLWAVETGYGEACSIYNAAYYYDITYSAADNNWVLVDGGYEFPETLPVLVKAENPVEEPVVPEGPKVVTAAEFNAATDNSIEYQVSGTISGIYQAYSSSYNNISIYISDETGEMLAYRLSCAGITDPANTLTKGDLITVKGKRTLYNEKPQMAQGCVIVEHTDVVVETPAGGATLSFADKANRTVFTTSQQVWEQNGVKLINDKASSTSNVADYAAPVRFYQGSKLTLEYAGMTKIEFTCNNGSYATELKNSIKTGTVTISGSVVTVVLDSAADSFVVASLAKQVRMDSLTVYAE